MLTYLASLQRWFDNSFDLTVYNYDWTANGPDLGPSPVGEETASLPVGTIVTTSPLGSYPVVWVNVADPAVVNGSVDVSELKMYTK